MKKILMAKWPSFCILLLIQSITGLSQYVYFNEVYQYDDVFHNPNTYGTFLLHDKYYSYASTYDININLRVVVMEITLDGMLVEESISEPGIEINTFGFQDNTTLLLSDSSVVGMMPIYNSNCFGLQSIGLVKFVDHEFQWSQDYSSLNGDCELYHRFYPKGLVNINDSTFMMYSLMRIGSSPNNPVESGSAFTYFNYEGEVVGHFESVDSDGADEVLSGMHVLEDKIIGFGTDGSGGANSIAQYDFEANIIDSINLGMHDFQNGSNSGVVMNDGYLIAINGRTTYHTLWLDPYIMEMHFMRINPDNLTILSDIQIPTPIDGILAHGIGVSTPLITSANDLVMYGARQGIEDPDDVQSFVWKLDSMGNVIWQNYDYQPPIPTDMYYFNSILEAPDGGYLLTGVINAEEFTVQKTWLLKIDACGYEQPSGCPEVVGIEGDGRHPELDSWSFPVWPSPFYNQLKALLPQNATHVFISDATGRTVFEEKVFYPNQTWNLSSLSDGVYVMSVELESGIIVSERIVKR